ncbi:MAG TPA: nuclear transport factor 2 family protein [Terriglobales bacterium]|nr:nuclear transport factor 2 family protein [Terriglobales bacterium]
MTGRHPARRIEASPGDRFGLEWREVAEEKQRDPEETTPEALQEGPLEGNPDVEDFFHRLLEKQDMRRPKPGPEAIAAALQAIQRLGARMDAEREQAEEAVSENTGTESPACAVCGYENVGTNQFCGMCGTPLKSGPELAHVRPGVPRAPGEAQHHYHHHYHHFVAGQDADVAAAIAQKAMGLPGGAPAGAKEGVKPRAVTPAPGQSRAEAIVRQMVQDWALACNNKQIDDVLEFYASDAMVVRPNIPPVRGTAAIREFFVAALQSGLGDVEMEPLRVDLLGDVAYQVGRCKMLVPVVVGKRREERGKFVIVLVKQQTGEWKAVVDCWSTDLGLNLGVETPAGPAASFPAGKQRRP